MTIDFEKHPEGLVPAIIQDAQNQECVNAWLYEPRRT
jgi:hypothetical protein